MSETKTVDPNLLLLSLGLSDSEPDEAAAPGDKDNKDNNSSTRAERTALSETAFQALKQSYRPKLENGELHATISLPLTPSAEPLPKPEAQALLHATEELYFLRRYAEAAGFARAVLDDGAGAARVDEETRRLLRYYEGRSLARLGKEGGVGGGGGGGGGEGEE